MRDDRERLRDILQALDNISRYANRGKLALEQDELLQTWMIHNLQILGEAARALSEPCRRSRPEIPWNKIVGMRNILVHGYFNLDIEVVWETVERSVPELKLHIERMLKDLEQTSD